MCFVPEELNDQPIEQPSFIVFALLLFLIVSLLSRFYPAVVLSRFQPVAIIQNRGYIAGSKGQKTWVLYFNIPRTEIRDKSLVLRDKLIAIPDIQKISFSDGPPADKSSVSYTLDFSTNEEFITTKADFKYADTSFFKLYGMELLAGRNFSQSDTVKEYIINETFANTLGFQNPEDIMGQLLGGQIPIVGVVRDFHTKSTREKIPPLAFTCQEAAHNTVHVLLPKITDNTDVWKSTISNIESAYNEVYPNRNFNHTFYDEYVASFYEKEQSTARLMNWCSSLAIFISCLGILGLIIFTTSDRMKEISIRKIFGANALQIAILLIRDILALFALAFIIVTPLAWWAMNEWLNDFAYRTAISWWVFALGGLILLTIALLTLSVRTVRAATANPVEALRGE